MKKKFLFFAAVGLLVESFLVNVSMSGQDAHSLTSNTKHIAILCGNDVKVIEKGQAGYQTLSKLSKKMDELDNTKASEAQKDKVQKYFDSKVARVCDP